MNNKMNKSLKEELQSVDWSSMGLQDGSLSMADGFEEELGKQSVSEDTKLRNEIAAEMLAKPELKAQRRSLSNSLEIINTLGYSDKGSFIDITQDTLVDAVAKGIVTVITNSEANKDKEGYVVVKDKNGDIIGGCLKKTSSANKFEVPIQKKPDGTFYEDESASKKKSAKAKKSTKAKKEKKGSKYRNLKSVSKLVGYIVRNCGEQPIQLKTQYCTKDETGKYIAGETVVVTLQPGETMPISKKFLAINSSSIEFSGKFANGIIVSSNKKAKGTPEEILNRYFFKFSAEAGLDIHGEDVKIPIATKVSGPDGDEWVIKDEYLPVFGTLMNKRVNSSSIRGIKADMSLDSQDALAKRLRDVLESTEVL